MIKTIREQVAEYWNVPADEPLVHFSPADIVLALDASEPETDTTFEDEIMFAGFTPAELATAFYGKEAQSNLFLDICNYMTEDELIAFLEQTFHYYGYEPKDFKPF